MNRMPVRTRSQPKCAVRAGMKTPAQWLLSYSKPTEEQSPRPFKNTFACRSMAEWVLEHSPAGSQRSRYVELTGHTNPPMSPAVCPVTIVCVGK